MGNQVAVVKITKTSDGEQRRNMMLASDVWERIVSGEIKEANVTWELRKVEPVRHKEVDLSAKDIHEVSLSAEPEKKEELSASPASEEEDSFGDSHEEEPKTPVRRGRGRGRGSR